MKLKTIPLITIAQAIAFEYEQGLKGIKKLNIFSQEDCQWEVEMGEYTLNKRFSAPVTWSQIQTYETGDPANPTGTKSVAMFQENFVLETADVQQLWGALQGQILATDILIDKMDEFVLAGLLYWVGNVRQIFGLDQSGFEVIEVNRPAPEQAQTKSISKKKKYL